LAQSESFSGKTFARYWMHNGLLKMGTAKMAGSVGNVVNVVDLLKQHSPETVRFLLLGTHYRSPIEWSEERLGEVKRSLEGFYRFFERYERINKRPFFALQPPTRRDEWPVEGGEFLAEVAEKRRAFLDCMDDDFNTGGAVGSLYELLTLLNRHADREGLEGGSPDPTTLESFRRGAMVLRELSQILGLFTQAPTKQTGGDDRLVGGLMQLLIDLRAEARRTKNFAVADQIRKRLGELGVTLEDRPGGTGWRAG
jgi:cysteinyl-tRNA synthetase